MRRLRALMMAGAATAALMGCETVGDPLEVLGKGVPPPDEFAVKTLKPLKMPAGGELPEPRLGEKSPLEYDPKADARTALLKGDATAKAAGPSDAERSLVDAAKVSGDKAKITARLAAAEAKDSSAWVAPTLLELLNLGGRREEDILNPNAEARRLATKGDATAPVNPNDKPAAKEAKKDDGYVAPTGPLDSGVRYKDPRLDPVE